MDSKFITDVQNCQKHPRNHQRTFGGDLMNSELPTVVPSTNNAHLPLSSRKPATKVVYRGTECHRDTEDGLSESKFLRTQPFSSYLTWPNFFIFFRNHFSGFFSSSEIDNFGFGESANLDLCHCV